MAVPSTYIPFSPSRSIYSPRSSRHNSESFFIPDSPWAEKPAPPSPSWLASPVRRLTGGRSRLLGICFVLGALFGYALSLRNHPSSAVPQIITKSPSHPISSIPTTEGPFSNDPNFFPPLDVPRSPKVPIYNRLSADSIFLSTAQHLFKQTPLTPLFIPFTRNSPMLEQTVLSYIAAGWPRSQIYIIDNSGTMAANYQRLLSTNNPFYLDYELFRGSYGINIIRTPTFFSFAQLQNFMLSTAINYNWTHYYWSHQDVAVLSYEDAEQEKYKSFYENTLKSLIALQPRMGPDAGGERWGVVWYSFDWLSLINVSAAKEIGPWDTFIPFYHTDCDYYERMRLSNLQILSQRVGYIYDLALHIPQPTYYFFGNATNSKEPNSERYQELKRALEIIMMDKNKSTDTRNKWQDEQKGEEAGGTRGDSVWSYDPKGFQKAWWDSAAIGRSIFKKKWGTLRCKPSKDGKKLDSMWEELYAEPAGL